MTLVVFVVALALPCLGAPPEWWNADWPWRARIDCPEAAGDVAWVRLPLASRTTPNGRDLRLIDSAGYLHPFEILHHDPKLTTLIQFQVPDGKPAALWLYFGNLQARPIETGKLTGVPDRAAAQARAAWRRKLNERKELLERQDGMQKRLAELQRTEKVARAGGNAPPQAMHELRQSIQQIEKQLREMRIPPEPPEPQDPTLWHPRRGVVLRVYRKAQPGHPQTLDDLRKLIGRSALEGAGFRSAISDGFNPFGPSDDYISVYEGHLRIDKAGRYAFCSASDDGSWIVVNDTTLLAWPGPHGWEGSAHGQKNGAIDLAEGVAHVRYYHEEGSDQQMAFLGWQPPGADRFSAIPDDQWLAVRQAKVAAWQSHDQPIVAVPEMRVLHTYWVRDTDAQQVTMMQFHDRSQSRGGKIVQIHWSFGDGLEAWASAVDHAYFRLGRPEVTLSVTDGAGNQDSVTACPDIWHVDVQAPGVRYGKAEDYLKIAADYDTDKLPQEELRACADFWHQLDQWAQHVRAAESYLRRFSGAPAVPRLAAEAAASCLQPQAYNPRRADELLKLAAERTTDQVQRADLMMRRAHCLAWDLVDYAQAESVYRAADEALKSAKGKGIRERRRQCLIGLGDVALLSADYLQAERLYRQAQEQAARPATQPEELAKTGSYPYTVEDLLARDEFEWALKTIDEWEDQFPLQKLTGITFFLRGKVLFVQQPGRLVLRYLELAEQVAPRAVHVPETVWLRANCLMAMGQHDKALDEFRRIRVDFTQSEFFERAADKIKQCQTRLNQGSGHAQGNN